MTRFWRSRWRLPVVVFVGAQLVLGLWWAGQAPAMLSYDSLRYIQNVTLGPWKASHSPLYDSLVLLCLTLTHGVAALVIVQTTVAAVALAFVATSMRQLGIRDWWIVPPAIAVTLNPACGAFVSTLWKDVPFALAQVFLLGTVIRMLMVHRRSPGHRVPRRYFWAVGIEFTVVALCRNNGFLVVFLIGAALVVTFAGNRMRVAAASVGALLVLAFAQLVVYPAVGILPASSSLAYGVFYGDIAVAYSEAPSTFDRSDLRLMASVAPLAHWAASNDCYTSDPLFGRPFSSARADAVKGRLASLWLKQLTRTPVLIVKTKLCRSSIAWDVRPGVTGSPQFRGIPLTVPDSLFGRRRYVPADVAAGLRPSPLTAELGSLAAQGRALPANFFWQAFLFRGAWWSYVSFAAVIVAAVRLRRRDIVVLVSLCAANQLVVMAANPVQLYRYMIAPIFVGMLAVPLFGTPRAERAGKGAVGAESEPAGQPADQLSGQVAAHGPGAVDEA